MTPAPARHAPSADAHCAPLRGTSADSQASGAPTPVEQELFDYVVSFLRRNTYQPSVREIAAHFGIGSTRTVSGHIRSLEDKGFVERSPTRSRCVRIKGVSLAGGVAVPLRARGSLAVPPRTPDETLLLDPRLDFGPDTFAWVAEEPESTTLGVRTGDYVVLTRIPPEAATPGSVVVASGNGRTRYYRIVRRSGGTILEPLTADGAAADPSRFEMIGQVRATIRRFDPPANPTRH